MKRKLIVYNIVIVLAMLFTSCEKDLDQLPLSSGTADNFFLTRNDFMQATNAIYAVALRGATLGNSYGYPDRLMNLSETRCDNLYAITDGVRGWEAINDFQTTASTNSYIREGWQNNYKGIEKANLLLEKIAAGGKEIIASDSIANRMVAEAKFLRAFCYFDLVRYFGKVPIVDKTITASEAKNYPRKPVADVYNFIMADLKDAIDSLPTTYPVADRGRPTKWAAKYMMALVHMTRSGPTYGIEGPGLGLNEWPQAYTLLNEIVTTGPFPFINTYSSLYTYAGENNTEVIFNVQYASTTSGTSAGTGAAFVWVLTPDGYFQSIGLSAQGANYQRPVSNDFLAKFSATDARRVFGVQNGYTYLGQTYTYSFYKKWVDKTAYGSGGRNDWASNFTVGSHTDALLLRAECTLNGGGGTQTEVDAAVNKVRTRASLGNITGVTKAQLLEERRREFYGEGKRWFDLQRSGELVTIMNAWRVADDNQNRINTITNNFVIYPVPESEINAAAGTYSQNLGYD